MHQVRSGWGFIPDPTGRAYRDAGGGSLQRSTNPKAAYWWVLGSRGGVREKWREGRRRERRRRNERGREGGNFA